LIPCILKKYTYICIVIFRESTERGDESPLFSSHMISKQKIKDLAEERIAELANGLFIVDISVSATNVIHVELDKHEGNVAIIDCMSVSRNVEHNLDREAQDFELHVSSAGLDKPFRVLAQYIKNIDREVKVVLQNGAKMEGILRAVAEKGITLETSRTEKPKGDGLSLSKSKKKKELIVEQHEFPFEQIKETKIVISFK
jgi:ribosome maturation factor RimP